VRRPKADKAAIQQQLVSTPARSRPAQKSIDEINAEQNRLRKRLDVIAPSMVKDYFRNAPLLDFMAPTIKVQQILLPNVVDDVNFIRVGKMDRCQTCHLAIDKKGYEKYPQPFTDPSRIWRPTSAAARRTRSTRPAAPVCHEGMGSRSASATRHTCRRTRSRRKSGRRSITGSSPHLWDYPMLPVGMTEASCAKCHKQQVFIPKAEKLNVAYATFERAGCYACHKTKGFEDVRKPGPILTKIDSKLSQDWVKNWIRNPKGGQADDLDAALLVQLEQQCAGRRAAQRGEINGIAAYLYANRRQARVRGEEPVAR
jgi:hypothetical protein